MTTKEGRKNLLTIWSQPIPIEIEEDISIATIQRKIFETLYSLCTDIDVLEELTDEGRELAAICIGGLIKIEGDTVTTIVAREHFNRVRTLAEKILDKEILIEYLDKVKE